MPTIDSTALAWVEYDAPMLKVRFHHTAGRYEYADVPPEVYRDLLAALSKGRYFDAHIRDRYFVQRFPDGQASR